MELKVELVGEPGKQSRAEVTSGTHLSLLFSKSVIKWCGNNGEIAYKTLVVTRKTQKSSKLSNISRQGPSWFKVAVSVADSDGTET